MKCQKKNRSKKESIKEVKCEVGKERRKKVRQNRQIVEKIKKKSEGTIEVKNESKKNRKKKGKM